LNATLAKKQRHFAATFAHISTKGFAEGGALVARNLQLKALQQIL
jgi:hypothetical protein